MAMTYVQWSMQTEMFVVFIPQYGGASVQRILHLSLSLSFLFGRKKTEENHAVLG